MTTTEIAGETFYSHTIRLRYKDREGNVSFINHKHELLKSAEPLESYITACDNYARDLLSEKANPSVDGVLYSVYGKTEYFISKYYFKYPNTTDREDRHGTYGQDRHQRVQSVHRGQESGRRNGGDRKTQRRAA